MNSIKQGMIGEAKLRVRYAETDRMGVVYHANFIIWFELGRVALLNKIGFRYRDLEREYDCHIAVVDVKCRYKAPAYYDDEINVRTWLKNIRGPVMHFCYEIERVEDNMMLAAGESTHIVVNSKFEKTKLPLKYQKAFEEAVHG